MIVDGIQMKEYMCSECSDTFYASIEYNASKPLCGICGLGEDE